MGCKESENDCADPGSNEALDGLLRTELDQLGAAEGDAAQICKDVITDDESGGLFKKSGYIGHSK
jgi:hypothetical protein